MSNEFTDKANQNIPEECPVCGTTIVGATPQDWWVHFDSDCNPLGTLYCFAEKPNGVTHR